MIAFFCTVVSGYRRDSEGTDVVCEQVDDHSGVLELGVEKMKSYRV